MATTTLSAIRSAVRERGDYPVSAKFTDDVLDVEIQYAWAELWSVVDLACQGFWDKDGTVATVANQAYVALPSDALAVRGVDILSGGEYQELDQIPIKERNRFGATTGQPVAFRLSSRGLELYPTPNAVYTIRVTYSPMVTAIAGSAVQMYNGWEDYVVWATVARLRAREEAPLGDVAQWMERSKALVIESVSSRKSSGPEYLPLHEDIPEDWY